MEKILADHGSVSKKIYSRLIFLYPPSFLRKHGAEMLQNFEDLEHDVGSRRFLWAFIISDLIKSLFHEYMEYLKNHPWVSFAIVIVVILGALFTWQVFFLQKAHSTFENYAAFRGCSEITSRTDTDGTCVTGSGQSIKIVKFDNRWFLDGDLPVCAIGFGSTCLINWP